MYRNLPLPFLLSLWEHPSVNHKVSLPVKSRLLLVTLFPTLPVSFWSLVSGSPQWQLIQAMNLSLIMLIPSVSVLNTGRGKGSYEFTTTTLNNDDCNCPSLWESQFLDSLIRSRESPRREGSGILKEEERANFFFWLCSLVLVNYTTQFKLWY